MKVEKLLSSKGKVKVLKILLRDGQANISRIVRETGLNHKRVEKHLEELKSANIAVERRYGKLRIYEANLNNPKVLTLKKLLETLETL
ncbi:MAG: winged helix-turn-helix domain-containing protein [Thermoprotei archaeon]|nr:winged helix-turn-helix domain-containing protein [Thermoprotei archaeon]